MEDGETCADSIAELEEACPDMYEATLDCVIEADDVGVAGTCLLACALSQMDI